MPRGIRVIGFDLMDTVLVDPFVPAIEEVTGLPVETVYREMDRDAWRLLELGEIDDREWGARFWRPGSGRPPLDPAAFRAAAERRYRFVPGMEELLGELAARGSPPLHVMSNYPRWYLDLARRFRLERFFAGHHLSWEVGARKPDPAYYRRVLSRLGVEPGELLFVDDRERNLAAARELGIRTVPFRDAASLRAALPARGR